MSLLAHQDMMKKVFQFGTPFLYLKISYRSFAAPCAGTGYSLAVSDATQPLEGSKEILCIFSSNKNTFAGFFMQRFTVANRN